jgi:cellulose synthase/poly-beta-1,6-N-acetylglucosamine synthase-like glycosyltransferase
MDEIYGSPFTPPVSVLLPAYNEQEGVVASDSSLLDLRYPRHEVIARTR